MTATSLDLSQIKTDVLSSAATFRTLIGLGSSDAVTFKEATLTSGTVTSSTPLINATQTWNDGATTFTGALLNITDTASASDSLLMDLQVGGLHVASLKKDAKLELGRRSSVQGELRLNSIAGNGGAAIRGNSYNIEVWTEVVGNWNSYNSASIGISGVKLRSTGNYSWSNTGESSGSADLIIARDAANTLAQRNGTNAQTFRLYNTYTSSTSFERLNVRWATNELIIDAEAGSGGGTLRGIKLGSATTSLLGFYGVTPVDQPLTVSDPTGGAIVDTEARTAIGEIIDRLQELGLIA